MIAAIAGAALLATLAGPAAGTADTRVADALRHAAAGHVHRSDGHRPHGAGPRSPCGTGAACKPDNDAQTPGRDLGRLY